VTIEIKQRFTGKVLKTVEKDTLSGAYLRGADLSGAYLRGAALSGAYLSGAYLSGAYLEGEYEGKKTRMAWQSHDLMAELLRRDAMDEQNAKRRIAKLKAAGLILMLRENCWDDFIELRDPLLPWALSVLRRYAQGDPEAPSYLLEPAAGQAEVAPVEEGA